MDIRPVWMGAENLTPHWDSVPGPTSLIVSHYTNSTSHNIEYISHSNGLPKMYGHRKLQKFLSYTRYREGTSTYTLLQIPQPASLNNFM
jgi:hypothetical protein